ncbi:MULTISPECIES: hypothetical protein [Paenibacillus]|uniref:Uncharacterized protein n=1 Tax=Paenibacillus lautus TaxID=1401 RepID=A0A1R1B5Z1_PAELA|nr:hypothetical protein [Paenibacillus lautus]OME94977.1 hypothetical protein BK123_07755 [Paenibacillus lautus]
MINFPCSTDGTPLFELIGKEVEVTCVIDKKPSYLKAEYDSKRISGHRKPEILWDIEYIPLTGDYKIIIIIVHQPKRFDTDVSSYNDHRLYVCNYSNVKVSQVMGGRILNLHTPEWHESLNYFRQYTEEIQDRIETLEDELDEK